MNAYAPNGALITKEYYTEEIKVMDSQLALGGLRLARVLNTILSGQSVPPMPDAAPAPRGRETVGVRCLSLLELGSAE